MLFRKVFELRKVPFPEKHTYARIDAHWNHVDIEHTELDHITWTHNWNHNADRHGEYCKTCMPLKIFLIFLDVHSICARQ